MEINLLDYKLDDDSDDSIIITNKNKKNYKNNLKKNKKKIKKKIKKIDTQIDENDIIEYYSE